MRIEVPAKQHRVGALFLAAAACMLFLCLKGGFFGYIGARDLSLSLPGMGSWNIPSGPFVLLFLATWLCGLSLLILLPRGLSRRQSIILLGGLALVCRLALLPHIPSDDINRYLWEGKMVQNGVNPYHHSPQSLTTSDVAQDDPYLSRVNHPDLPAAYPPFALILFSVVTRMRYSPMAIKLLMIAFDMGTLFCILALLRKRGIHYRWATLYAFNPIILYSFAGQAHFDTIQNFFLLTSLILYDRQRWAWMFIALGLAIQSKYVAILALPFFIRRSNMKYVGLLALPLLLPYVPFLAKDNRPLFFCITHFAEDFAFNGSIHAILMKLFQSLSVATLCSKISLLIVLIIAYRHFHPERKTVFRNDPVSGVFFVLGALLILSPTVHFWYLSWIIPFLCLRPTASWVILCGSTAFYFVTHGIQHHTGAWHLPLPAQLLEWTPFFLLLFHEAGRAWQRSRHLALPPFPRSLSVIIPTHNEEANIANCIATAKQDAAVREIIVVDANSTDRTVALSQAEGSIVIHHTQPPEAGGGRGGQIAAGLEAATGDVVAVLHADTILDAPGFTTILEKLQKEPMVIGGAVGSVFLGRGRSLRLLEIANDFRAAGLGVSFGDQVQFFRRSPIVQQSAFPNIPLMEDVELSLRLPRFGRTVFLFGSAKVSPRRWKHGHFARAVLIIRLVAQYLLQRLFAPPDTRTMYHRYYGQPTKR